MAKDIDIKIDFSALDEELKKMSKELKGYSGVRVGYIEGEKELKGNVDISTVAIANEFGFETSKGVKVPPRPFMRITLKKQDTWKRTFKKLINKGLSLKQALISMGDIIRDDIKESIDSNIPPENAESTIKKKGHANTLIDTGTMRNSIKTEVIESKK